MIRIEAKIEAIVKMLSRKHNYIYESWQGANEALERLDIEDFPVCINVLPVSGSLQFQTMQSVDAPNCMIAFLDRARELDFIGDTNELSVNKCKDAAREFVELCNGSGWFEWIDYINYSVIYDKMDATLTGIMLDVRLQEKQGAPICPIKRTYPNLRIFDDTHSEEFN